MDFKAKKNKKITSDVVYAILAVAFMNAVLQIIIYPQVNNNVAADVFGKMIYVIGIISVLAPSFGLAVNNIRLVLPGREKASNLDFLIVLQLFGCFSVIIVCIIGIVNSDTLSNMIIWSLIVLITTIRNYATVEYRLSLDYKKQFIFYFVLSIGYIWGLLIFFKTKEWHAIFLAGEFVAVIYVFFTGKILNELKKPSVYFKVILKKSTILALSYLLTNIMLNLDRFVLSYYVGNQAVSEYYVISLIGKTIAIISGPLNSIIISYITKKNKKINLNMYRKIICCISVVGIVFLGMSVCVTPVFVKLLYPNFYQDIIAFNLVVNSAQILYFLTNIMLIIILTICTVKWQLIVQIIYAISFLCTAILFTKLQGMEGFAKAALLSNSLYFILTIFVGKVHVKKNCDKWREE